MLSNLENFKHMLDLRQIFAVVLVVGIVVSSEGETIGAGSEDSGPEGLPPAEPIAVAGADSVHKNKPNPENTSDPAGLKTLLDSFQLGRGQLDWRGKQFNLGEVEMVYARFEKFLNSPPSTTENELTYDTLLTEISHRLIGKGGGTSSQRISEAWRMLYRASQFPMDAGLSEILADRIVSFWQTNDKIAALDLQTERLENDRQYREIKIQSIQDRDRKEFIELTRGKNNEEAPPPPSLDHLSESDRKRLDKIEAKIEENESYGAISKINQKLEFQSLVLQFFIQRRFQHTLIANDFYRYIFDAEDNVVEGADALKGQVFGDLDVKITTSTLDTLSKEAISDVETTIKAVDFLLERGEVHAASKRLLEAFYLGEYLPAVKRYPLEKKRKIGIYLRDLTSLVGSLEVKSFDRAASKLKEIEAYASDFDGGRADAFIQTAKQLSNLSVQRALSAAYVEDRAGVEAALEAAVGHWPMNTEIQKFSERLLEKTNLVDLAAVDFDRFFKQNDFRAIFNDRFRFAAALNQDGKRNNAFLDIMKRMEVIESALAQARELSRISNHYGAWEVLERVYREHSDDAVLNRMRGDYAAQAAQFASVISAAEISRGRQDFSLALIQYLNAQKLYPASFFVEEGIETCVLAILEERSEAAVAISVDPEAKASVGP